MKKIIILLMMLISSNCFSQNCPSIENDIARLSCFDEKYPTNSKSESILEFSARLKNNNEALYLTIMEDNDVRIGNWVIKYDKDEMTDNLSWMAVNPELGVSMEAVKKGKSFNSLLLSCIRNKPTIGVMWEKYLGLKSPSHDVMLKISLDEPMSEYWEIISKTLLIRSYSNKNNIKFLKEVSTNKDFMIRTTPYNSTMITAKFDITGMNEILDMFKKDCPGKIKYWN